MLALTLQRVRSRPGARYRHHRKRSYINIPASDWRRADRNAQDGCCRAQVAGPTQKRVACAHLVVIQLQEALLDFFLCCLLGSGHKDCGHVWPLDCISKLPVLPACLACHLHDDDWHHHRHCQQRNDRQSCKQPWEVWAWGLALLLWLFRCRGNFWNICWSRHGCLDLLYEAPSVQGDPDKAVGRAAPSELLKPIKAAQNKEETKQNAVNKQVQLSLLQDTLCSALQRSLNSR